MAIIQNNPPKPPENKDKVSSSVTGTGSIHREDPRVKEREDLRPVKKTDPIVSFKGMGRVIYRINGKSVMVRFKSETGFKFSTNDKDLIEALRKDGYKEV